MFDSQPQPPREEFWQPLSQLPSHKCGCGNTKDTKGYCDGSHEEEEL